MTFICIITGPAGEPRLSSMGATAAAAEEAARLKLEDHLRRHSEAEQDTSKYTFETINNDLNIPTRTARDA